MLLQEDGTESCLGVSVRAGISFLINGKSDGNAVDDAGTQVMSGLLGAILQPQATRSRVVGLGTGSTAGWLADIPAMERVDVVELERAVLKVADLCAPVNQNVLSNPKIQITIGDARETLLTTREHYDLIVSEPSNPHPAGVASLYTKEYYGAAAQRSRAGGLFLQFVQAYEVDSATIRSIYATFCSVSPVVETWQTNQSDLLFVGSREPVRYDVAALRKRISEPPFKLALVKVWRVTNLEGFLAHYVANDSFAKEFAGSPHAVVNTDDRNFIEFGFARTVGKSTGLKIPELREAAHRRSQDRPALTGGDVDWGRVDDQNLAIDIHLGLARPSPYNFLDDGQRRRLAAESAYVSCRTDPWVMSGIFQNSFEVAHDLASRDPSGALARQLYHALEQPFSVYAAEGSRRKTLALIAVLADNGGFSEYTRKAVASFEPHVPWDLEFPEVRRNCYRALGDPRAAKADRELSQFLTAQPQPLASDR